MSILPISHAEYRFEFGTVTSHEFKVFFLDTFKENKAVQSLDWDNLFYSRGI